MKLKLIIIELESDNASHIGEALTEMLEVAFPPPERKEAALSAHETKEG